MHLLFTPNHVQLLNACYPPSSVLLTAGSDHLPNSHELSRLTYYASNHPGKQTKLGSELEKRLKAECRKAHNGNSRSRASLLVTLSIFRSLATECRRDIVLLSPTLMASVETALAALPMDLEVIARTATVFTAWTTYTDGHLIGADSNMTRDYLSCLGQFAALSCGEAVDHEIRNRTRLIGFAALTGALNSEALYNDSMQFRAQVSIVLRPILVVLFQTDVSVLDEQASAVKDAPKSHYLAEFRTRPAMERRAASIHVHVDGDKGPSKGDVTDAALRALFSLLSHANGVQLGYIMQSSFDNLDSFNGWEKPDHCCWFVQRTAEWAQYQYRYVVPTWLVERLMENQESPVVTSLHVALTAMLTTVFDSSTPLVNLSSSDIMANLMALLLRRVTINPGDALLPAVIECISSLGRHVYYSDQIQDLAGELVSRLVIIEVQGVLAGRGQPSFAESRSTAMRCLLRGLLGLINAANKHETGKRGNESISMTDTLPLRPRSLSIEAAKKEAGASDRSSRRTRIPPDIWQDTLSLLCDHDFAVRSDCSDALIFYLTEEIPKRGDQADSDGVKRVRKLADGPFLQAAHFNILLNAGDAGNKFLNAIHAYIYILATAPSLGLMSQTSPSPSPRRDASPTTRSTSDSRPDIGNTDLPDSPAHSQANGRRSFSAAHGLQAQKVSLVRNLLDRAPSYVAETASASLSDYRNILQVLITVQEQIPVRGLLTGVPMLIALDAATKSQDIESISLPRTFVLKDIIAQVWLSIAKVWNSSELAELAERAILCMPIPSLLPKGAHEEMRNELVVLEPVSFEVLDAETVIRYWEGININEALVILSSNQTVQEAIGLDKDGLYRRLSSKWTVDSALRDAVDRLSNFESTVRGDGLSPLLKISPALMHIENISLQSLSRSARGLGVTDLREALEGRSSMSNPALARPPSISTLDHTSSITGGDAALRLTRTRSRSRTKKRVSPSGAGEVRDVLTRLGIGKQNGNLLKASFPALQRPENRLR